MKRTLTIVQVAPVLLALALMSGCAHHPKPAPAPPTTPTPVPTPTQTAPAPTPTPPAPTSESTSLRSEDLQPVFFDFDSAALTEAARGTLDKNSKTLRDHADAKLVVEGHCDERGTVEYNQALGERRAQAAREYLVAAGINASRLEVISYGKERPFDPGHDESAWAKNRRAHFTLK
jgi:peptidoglycan-associated lipoprotein